MSNIEKIRQEIERRKKELDEQIVDIYDSKAVLRKDELQKLLAFIDSLPEESENHGCGVEFPHFGANYPDAKCIDGYLWDMDSYEDGFYTIGGDDPCPICNTEEWLEDVLDDKIFKTRDEALEYVKVLKSKYGKHKDSLPEEMLSYVTDSPGDPGNPGEPGISDLEKAALEYIQGTLCDLDDGPTVGLAKGGFIAGAEWQKEQMMKEAVEGVIVQDLLGFLHSRSTDALDEKRFKYRDKVKIIIVKE